MKRYQIVMMFIGALLTAGAASAQEKGQAGIAMGIPSTVAFLWHPSENVGLRPEIGFTRNSAENDSGSSGFSVESRTWNLNVGASAIFYMHKVDNLHPYFSPRFVYTRATAHTEASSPANFDSKTTVNQYSTSGSFGAQYAINRRFGAFGEVGLVYSHQNQKSELSGAGGSLDSFGTRASVGVILYF